jgi:D-glycero-D-manno-heptose 1,7-bisphosphate phosphatase
LVLGNRAVFVDRDGVLNDLVYNEEEGQVVSPFSSRQLRVFPFVPDAIKTIRDGLGFQVIVVSNQPGVSKRQFTLAELERMNEKIRRALADYGTGLDGEYYCLHHPNALIPKYRVVCNCRKPKPGLLLRAAKEKGIDLAESYFAGDGLVDVKAGKRAGCRTILLGHMTTFLSRLIEEEDASPDYIVPTLREVPALLRRLGKT